MEYLEKQTRAMVVRSLEEKGFSVGEAESREEGLESEQLLEQFIRYMREHQNASMDEIRVVHTSLLRQQEAQRIETKKQKSVIVDEEAFGKELLIREARIDWKLEGLEAYLYHIDALRGLKKVEFRKPITFWVGENGCGKSTLLEALAVAAGFNPEGGTKNYRFSTNDTHSGLYHAISFVKGARKPSWGIFLRAETFYNMSTEAENLEEVVPGLFQRYGGESFHKQSHGESFYTMLETDITDNGLYFLDEPEAALSPRRQLNLLGILHKYANRGAQFIIATHSPILLACPDACIYEFSCNGIQEISYEETDIYKIVSGFVKNRDKMLGEVILDEKKF